MPGRPLAETTGNSLGLSTERRRHHRIEHFDNPGRQATVAPVEMAARVFLTGPGETHDLCWSDGPGHRQKLWRNRDRFLDPGHAARAGIGPHDAKGVCALHRRLTLGQASPPEFVISADSYSCGIVSVRHAANQVNRFIQLRAPGSIACDATETSMSFPVLEHFAKSARHTTFFLSCGAPQATPIIFAHGWPELSISWREQLPAFAALGFRAIAPDMRGYGRSSVYPRHEDYALEEIVADMIQLLGRAGLRRRSGSVTIGDRRSSGRSPSTIRTSATAWRIFVCPTSPRVSRSRPTVPLADRTVYPADKFPAGAMGLSIVLPREFRRCPGRLRGRRRRHGPGAVPVWQPVGQKESPPPRPSTRANGGWFRAANRAPDVPRDPAVLSEEDERRMPPRLSVMVSSARTAGT